MFGNAQARARRRLTAVAARIAQARGRIDVLEEQVAFLGQVEADAATDAVVGDNPVAAREHRTARSDLERARRERDELRATVEALRQEQDRLLESLLADGPLD